jgi:hypothetical protein
VADDEESQVAAPQIDDVKLLVDYQKQALKDQDD